MILARAPRAKSPISRTELERRWAAVRREMTARGLDAVVMHETNEYLGGSIRWFSDVAATNGYGRAAVFHKDDLMTVVMQGPTGGKARLDDKDPLQPGLGELLFNAAYSSVNYTAGYEAVLVCDALEERGYKHVGLVGTGKLPYAFVTTLRERLGPAIEISDVTDWLDALRAIKSPEEIGMIRAATKMQDTLFAKAADTIRPGMSDADLMSYIEYEGHLLGSESGIFMGGSAPLGERATFRPRHFQGRTMAAGDHITILIENSGPGGFFTELARTLSLGPASDELHHMAAAASAAQANTARNLQPGRSCADVFAAHNTYMREHDLPPELRLFSHSQGYDMVERPLVRDDESMTVAANMYFAIHPAWETPTAFLTICDNYLIHENGENERLHATEQRIFEV